MEFDKLSTAGHVLSPMEGTEEDSSYHVHKGFSVDVVERTRRWKRYITLKSLPRVMPIKGCRRRAAVVERTTKGSRWKKKRVHSFVLSVTVGAVALNQLTRETFHTCKSTVKW